MSDLPIYSFANYTASVLTPLAVLLIAVTLALGNCFLAKKPKFFSTLLKLSRTSMEIILEYSQEIHYGDMVNSHCQSFNDNNVEILLETKFN